MYHDVEDEVFAESHPHGDAIEVEDVVVGGEDVVAVDVLERVHVVDGHGARVAQEVADEEDYLGYLHGLESYHLVEYHREQHLQDEEGCHRIAQVQDHVLEAGLA